ncbi:MAG: phosphate ABC transporter substrate-binding protein PstS [Actinomycetota bacterium]|nr:phosphate ABC transporter substrate-binding protein PstS [Actinomycetota bacterium]
MKSTSLRRVAAPGALALSAVLAFSACSASNEEDDTDTDTDSAPAAGGDFSGTLSGGGASSQEAAMEAWRAGFQEANPEVTVNYDPVGSGGGREGFIDGGFIFAGSDSYLEGEELTAAEKTCGGTVVEIPSYISPIAVIYNLPDVDALNLSPEVLAGIFAGEITAWDDEAIAADNDGVELPDLEINPVHRQDESGTTGNFTSYMDATAPDVWTYGETEVWPDVGGEAGAQTSGVVSAVEAGEGSIGYADASQAGELGTAAIGVGEEFVEYSPEAAAAVVDASERVEGRGETDLVFDIARDTTEEGVYPIVLVSYHLACTTYEDETDAELTNGFLTYVISPEGQDAAAENAGSAPISDTIREQAQAAVDQIEAG